MRRVTSCADALGAAHTALQAADAKARDAAIAQRVARSALEAIEVDMETKRSQGLDDAVEQLSVFATAARHRLDAAQDALIAAQESQRQAAAEMIRAQSDSNAAEGTRERLQQLSQALGRAAAAATFAVQKRELAAELAGTRPGSSAMPQEVCFVI